MHPQVARAVQADAEQRPVAVGEWAARVQHADVRGSAARGKIESGVCARWLRVENLRNYADLCQAEWPVRGVVQRITDPGVPSADIVTMS